MAGHLPGQPHQLGQRQHARAGDLIGLADGLAAHKHLDQRPREVLHPDGLQLRIGAGQRHQREARLQHGEQVDAAVSGTDDEGGAQHGQVECAGLCGHLQHGLAGRLAAQIARRGLRVHAQRADMHQAAHTGGGQGGREAPRQLHMHMLEGGGAALQDGDQVDDGVVARHEGRQVAEDIGLHDCDAGQALHRLRVAQAAGGHGDAHAGAEAAQQLLAQRAADEAAATEYQDGQAHDLGSSAAAGGRSAASGSRAPAGPMLGPSRSRSDVAGRPSSCA
mmetsp:Transcript_118715/g.329937  ORF Transcript_118715/g.329937 Transcript_118715/m.329937 type:complete len:277 (+) Transcript_118715:3056-3886(+)